jgi:ribonuclease HII
MYQFEIALLDQGVEFICGVDEAGRGPLAGPVVAGAVILNPDDPIDGLNDSKQLSEAKREKLAVLIRERALAYAVHFVSPAIIDEINIYQASKLAMLEAIKALKIQPQHILSDAMPLKESNIPFTAIIKGDTLSASIAAGSILAKVERDHYMQNISLQYPGYGFEQHKGYPTKEHILALALLGITPIHRKTYRPVKDVMEKQLSFNLGTED